MNELYEPYTISTMDAYVLHMHSYVDFNQLSAGNKMPFCAFPWPKASNKIMVDFVWGAKLAQFYWDYLPVKLFFMPFIAP